MTKVGIIGDVHLGASIKAGQKDQTTGVPSRLLDYKDTLYYAISYVSKHAKTLVFTGDIFEHRFPHMVQQQIFSECLHYALSIGIEQIYILIGNHDQQRTSSTTTLAYLSELKLPNIVVVDEPSTVDINGHKLHFYPYRDRKHFGVSEYQEAIEKSDEICKLLAKNNGSKSNILIGHMAIEGTFFAEEESELYTDTELMMKKSSFADFDLTVMGHVHTPALISQSPPIYYVGSLEKRGAFENHEKQLMIVDFDSKDSEYHSLPCRAFFEYVVTVPKSGVDFEKILFDTFDTYSAQDDLNGNIVKCQVNIKSEDIGHFDSDKVRDFFLKKGCNFVFPPKLSVESERVLRSTLVETSSDTDTWTKHIMANVKDAAIQAELIAIGSEIISEVEV